MASLDSRYYFIKKDARPSYLRIVGGEVTSSSIINYLFNDCTSLEVKEISSDEFESGRLSVRRNNLR